MQDHSDDADGLLRLAQAVRGDRVCARDSAHRRRHPLQAQRGERRAGILAPPRAHTSNDACIQPAACMQPSIPATIHAIIPAKVQPCNYATRGSLDARQFGCASWAGASLPLSVHSQFSIGQH
eukprot:3793730-Pleurochrysis_carterae.AAC.1